MHLLIDGKNLLYRGIYASLNTATADHFVAISRMMHSYLHKFGYGNVHVFWDDKKENLWRREILQNYKDSECRDKPSEVEEKLIRYQEICEDTWKHMNIKQYKKSRMEADDLIFAFCHLIHDETVIVSNDGDMTQISYRYDHVKIYNPLQKIVCNRPSIDPVLMKCLDGDKSDNIHGYYGIGPKKATKCIENTKMLWELISRDNASVYITNRKLIDLSLCPYLNDNMIYIMEYYNQPIKFDKKLIIELLYSKHKVKGIMAEFKSLISPFMMIGENNGSTCRIHTSNDGS